MTDTSEPYRHLRDNAYSRALPTMDALLSQAELVARIEAARLEDAGAGPMPRDVVFATQVTRVCCRCYERKPLAAFYRDRNQPLGREYICKLCKRASDDASYARKKRAAFRRVLGGGRDAV